MSLLLTVGREPSQPASTPCPQLRPSGLLQSHIPAPQPVSPPALWADHAHGFSSQLALELGTTLPPTQHCPGAALCHHSGSRRTVPGAWFPWAGAVLSAMLCLKA